MARRAFRSFGWAARWLCLFALLAVGACAVSGPLAPKSMDRDAKAQRVPADKAALYVYRPREVYGSAILKELDVDGKSMTRLGVGNYAFRLVEPGDHTITINCGCEIPVRMGLEAAPGNTYFVILDSIFIRGPGYPSSRLALVRPVTGREALKDSRLVHWLR